MMIFALKVILSLPASDIVDKLVLGEVLVMP